MHKPVRSPRTAHADIDPSMNHVKAGYAGHAIYSPLTLSIYDILVLGISNPLIWKCPTDRMLALYNEAVTDNHLDVGVGTGWYLDRCRFPGPSPRLALMDLNPNSLDKAASRVERYHPEQHHADILHPVDESIEPFSSIALTYLFHCLPGNLRQKAVVFDHLKPLLKPDGEVFGATLLAQGVERSGMARWLMGVYNRKHIFSNDGDTLDDLREVTQARFAQVDIQVVGCVALFRLKRPR